MKLVVLSGIVGLAIGAAVVIPITFFNGDADVESVDIVTKIISQKPTQKIPDVNSLPSNVSINAVEDVVMLDFEENLTDQTMYLAEGLVGDAVSIESRKFAETTAHMSGDQLKEYRILKAFPVVRGQDGLLITPYVESQTCADTASRETCSSEIINQHTKHVVFNGQWGAEFKVTGVGLEVVKVK